MSTHIVTNPANIMDGLDGLLPALTAAIRAPTSYAFDGTNVVYTFLPDLTAAEAATFADTVATLRTREVELSVAEYQAIKADIAGLRTYAGIASPTLAQTVSAVKAQSRILRALLRDG